MYTYRDAGITEMDSATESIYLEDPGVNQHHHKIQNTHSLFPSSLSNAHMPRFHRSTEFVRFLTYSCHAFIDPWNLCSSSWPGIPSYSQTLFLCSLSQNGSLAWIFDQFFVRCSGVLLMGCQSSISTCSPHCDWANLKIHFKVMLMQTRRQ